MIHTRLTGLLTALLLGALLLAGCSSGGGEPTVSQGVHDLLQHELDTTLEELKAEQAAKQSAETARRTAQAEVTRLEGVIGNMNDAPSAATTASLHARLNHAQAEVTRLTDDLTTAQTALTAANTRVTELNTLVGDATNPAADSLRGQVAKLKTDLATAQGRVEGLESQLGTAQTRLEEEETKREAAEQEAATAKTEAERQIEEAQRQADANTRASGLITALSSNFPDTTEATMGVSHMPGESLTFRRPSALPAKGSAPNVPGGWRSASYSGPRGSVGTDTVYLYTNIQAPGSKAFWKEHGEEVTTIEATDATVSGFGTQAKELYPGEGGTLDGSGTTSGDTARSIGGTYDGYSGTFKCDSGCEIAADDGGDLTFTGDWTFTASLTARRSSNQAVQDTEFLYFGIWAFEPTDPADTTNTHNLRWAAGGDANNIANFTALTGEATFTGGAIGKYALTKATGRGARAARTGTFTATARFTADFDDADSPGTISGRITGFKEGGSDLGSDWHVFLGSSASAAAALAATGATGSAHGAIDGDTATGTWGATLHGSDNHVFTDRTKYPTSRYPVADVAGVAGWFRAAAGTNAAIAGAFGAACTTGTMCAK